MRSHGIIVQHELRAGGAVHTICVTPGQRVTLGDFTGLAETRADATRRSVGSSMAACRQLETCYHRVGDGEAAPRRRRRVRIFALLGATALGWCLLTTAEQAVDTSNEDNLSTQEPMAPQPHALREVRAVRGWLNHTLTVKAGVWHLPQGISFHTRLYNGAAPSPVLWAAPGDRVRLTIRNRLGADLTAPDHALGFRQANTTNLHLHGVYDDAVHDNTFARVHPGACSSLAR